MAFPLEASGLVSHVSFCCCSIPFIIPFHCSLIATGKASMESIAWVVLQFVSGIIIV